MRFLRQARLRSRAAREPAGICSNRSRLSRPSPVFDGRLVGSRQRRRMDRFGGSGPRPLLWLHRAADRPSAALFRGHRAWGQLRDHRLPIVARLFDASPAPSAQRSPALARRMDHALPRGFCRDVLPQGGSRPLARVDCSVVCVGRPIPRHHSHRPFPLRRETCAARRMSIGKFQSLRSIVRIRCSAVMGSAKTTRSIRELLNTWRKPARRGAGSTTLGSAVHRS